MPTSEVFCAQPCTGPYLCSRRWKGADRILNICRTVPDTVRGQHSCPAAAIGRGRGQAAQTPHRRIRYSLRLRERSWFKAQKKDLFRREGKVRCCWLGDRIGSKRSSEAARLQTIFRFDVKNLPTASLLQIRQCSEFEEKSSQVRVFLPELLNSLLYILYLKANLQHLEIKGWGPIIQQQLARPTTTISTVTRT